MKNLAKCQREFLLDCFQQDAAENQREYLQHCLKMPWEMYLRAWVTRIRHLSRMVRYLPCLADMEDAPAGIERANRELSKIELFQLIMRAIPSEWRESYRCLPQGRFTPADSDKLLRDLEPIEAKDRSMKRKMANGGGPSIPRKKFKQGGGGNGDKAGRASASGGGQGGPPKKKHCGLCEKFGGRPETHYTNQCRRWTKDGKPLKGFSQGKNDKNGVNKKQFSQFMTFMSQVTAFEKKRAKDKKRKRKRDDSDSDSDSE